MDSERIEDVFAKNGIAFEYRDYSIVPYEPEAEEIGVMGVEDESLHTQDPSTRTAIAVACIYG